MYINIFNIKTVIRWVLSITLTLHRRKLRCREVSILAMITLGNREVEPGFRARQPDSRDITFSTTRTYGPNSTCFDAQGHTAQICPWILVHRL